MTACELKFWPLGREFESSNQFIFIQSHVFSIKEQEPCKRKRIVMDCSNEHYRYFVARVSEDISRHFNLPKSFG